MTAPVLFLRRPYPSANAVLLTGPRPVLVDPGFGADVAALEAWLRAIGTPPERLAGLVNTHFDCDHVGANHALAARYGLPIATGAAEAAMVNAPDPEACRARWLHQPVEPYRVARGLEDGDVIDTGAVQWRVLATPGHTAGHISLYAAEPGLLVTGDVVHADDIGWLDPRRQDVLEETDATIARLAALPLAQAYCGHGPVMQDPHAALAAARLRLAGWRQAPERMAWHGLKRVFAYALMIEGGLAEADLGPYLYGCPWFRDYAAHPFGMPVAALTEAAVAEMLRSGAARWEDGWLRAAAAHVVPGAGWARAPTEVASWPR